MTNGDMIKTMFPNVEVKEKNNGYEVYFGIGTAIQFFNYKWWNASYKALEQQPCEGMRDATEEERKSTKDYIDSISKPTGLQFDDVYEELDFVRPHKKISVNLQLCEDAISRTEAIKNFASWYGYDYDNQGYYRLLKQMPSVTPSYNSIKTELKPCKDCISREEVLNLFRPSEELQDSTLSKHWFDFVSKYINELPSVQLQKKKGKWIVTEDDLDGINFPSFSCECSECGADFSWKTDFCPGCGAEMESEDAE